MIKLKTVQRMNPLDKTAVQKYYVSTQSAGEVTLEKMSELISEKCTLTETDVLAALNALSKEMTTHLMEGKIVRFGTFERNFSKVSNFGKAPFKSTGVDTEAEASRTQVTSTRVKFRPGRRIEDSLLQLKYTLTAK